jgi:hypothetical protein
MFSGRLFLEPSRLLEMFSWNLPKEDYSGNHLDCWKCFLEDYSWNHLDCWKTFLGTISIMRNVFWKIILGTISIVRNVFLIPAFNVIDVCGVPTINRPAVLADACIVSPIFAQHQMRQLTLLSPYLLLLQIFGFAMTCRCLDAMLRLAQTFLSFDTIFERAYYSPDVWDRRANRQFRFGNGNRFFR